MSGANKSRRPLAAPREAAVTRAVRKSREPQEGAVQGIAPESQISDLKSQIPVASDAFRLVKDLGRDPAIVAFERQVVDFFIDASDILGAPKSVAAIYGIIFASPEPLGFLELQERLDISAGSISQGLKALKTIGAIKPATAEDWEERQGTKDQGPETLRPMTGARAANSGSKSLVPGPSPVLPKRLGEGGSLVSSARREFYVPNLEARKLVSTWIDQRLQKQLDAGERRLATISTAPVVARDRRIQERLDQLNNWHEKASAVLPLVKAFLNMPAATTMAQVMNPFRRQKSRPTV